MPEAIPPTVPPATEATVVLPLLHTPPEEVSISVVVVPLQILAEVGDIAAGPGITVTTLPALQLPTV